MRARRLTKVSFVGLGMGFLRGAIRRPLKSKRRSWRFAT